VTQYKCLDCFLGYIREEDSEYCPDCGSLNLQKHCEKDVPCHCAKTIHETVKLCDVCGEPVCPGCGCHDVAAISRITGYMSEIGGWSAGKRAEFKDRYRVDIE
jgi:hypothetical protein